ncbi:MAG: type II toxin-antitoxin system RelE/ParE family toxin [Methylocella sp.]
MAYRVELTSRASRDLARLCSYINAANSEQARAWFNGLEAAVYSLDRNPARGATIPEDESLRHLLYGKKPRLYRIIYGVDERRRAVTVLHIRYAARQAYTL